MYLPLYVYLQIFSKDVSSNKKKAVFEQYLAFLLALAGAQLIIVFFQCRRLVSAGI